MWRRQLRQNEKLSALGLLAAEVAHEIRNPLTVMKMLFHSLDLRFPQTDPRSRDVEIMGQKMDLLNRIVEQILDFARNSEPKLETVNLNELIEDLGLLTRHKLRNHGIKLERQLDPGLPLVEADAAQLEQAFLNLTLNAVEAMPDGGLLKITSRFQERSAGEPPSVVVEFTDNGEGMTELQQQQASLPSCRRPKPGETASAWPSWARDRNAPGQSPDRVETGRRHPLHHHIACRQGSGLIGGRRACARYGRPAVMTPRSAAVVVNVNPRKPASVARASYSPVE